MPCFGSLVCRHMHTIQPKTHTRRPAVSLMRRAFTAAPKIQSFWPEFGFKSLANRPPATQTISTRRKQASVGRRCLCSLCDQRRETCVQGRRHVGNVNTDVCDFMQSLTKVSCVSQKYLLKRNIIAYIGAGAK